MTLGIVGALPGELGMLAGRAVAPGAVTRRSDGVLLVHSGVGAQRAAAAGRLLLAQGATALVSWGCAGALESRPRPGNLLLPERVIAADGNELPVSRDWQRRLYECLQGEWVTYTEPLATSRGVIAGPVEKRRLGERSGALAVDMESAPLGELAQAAGVPFVVIRAIADTVDMPVPRAIGAALDPFGQVQALGLLAGLVRSPSEWPALVRLVRGFRAAQATLAGVAQRTGGDLLYASALSPTPSMRAC